MRKWFKTGRLVAATEADDPGIRRTVEDLLANVVAGGDAAARNLSIRFDD
jgi:histidinol dehydrogenase